MTSNLGNRAGTAAPAPLAGCLADVDAVEIKVTIRPDQELCAERAMEVSEADAQARTLYFYDTPGLELFDAGAVLRARHIAGDDDDSTVKFRPVQASKIAKEWRQSQGFKLEADSVGDHLVCSASLTVVQKRGEIDEVAKRKRPIERLFSKDQERFLCEFCVCAIDFRKLRVLGPIRVLRWKSTPKRFQHELTLEEWRLPNGDDLVEVSIKTTPEQALQARKDFEQHLRDLDLDPEGSQAAKTRTVLQHFAKTLGSGEP